MIEERPIQTQTIIRTFVLFLALINQLLASFGKSPLPFGEVELEQMILNIDLAISSVITVATALWSWWKNNSFTQKAREADEILREK